MVQQSRGLQEEFGTTIELQDDGNVSIFGDSKDKVNQTKAKIELICAEPEEGKEYDGVVAKVVRIWSLCNVFTWQGWPLTYSQIKQDFEHLTDVINEGDKIRVKITEVGRQGRIKLELVD